MTWFTNLQLLWKVLGVTLTVCVVTVGVGLVGYRGVQQTTADVNSLGSGLIPKVAAADHMHQSMYEAVADLRGATLATDPADIKDFVAGSGAAMGETDPAFAQYQALPLSTDEKRILTDYNPAHTAWESASQQALVALEAPPPPVAVSSQMAGCGSRRGGTTNPRLIAVPADRQASMAAARADEAAATADETAAAADTADEVDASSRGYCGLRHPPCRCPSPAAAEAIAAAEPRKAKAAADEAKAAADEAQAIVDEAKAAADEAKAAIVDLIDAKVSPQTDTLDGVLDQLRQSNEQQTTEILAAALGRSQMTGIQLLGAVAIALLLATQRLACSSRGILPGRARRVEQTVKSLADSDASWLADALEAMSNQDLTDDVWRSTSALLDLGHDEIGQTAAAANRLREKIGATIASYGRARMGLRTWFGRCKVPPRMSRRRRS